MVVLLMLISIDLVDRPGLKLVWVVIADVYLGQTLHLLIEYLSFHLEFKQHFCLLFEEVIGQTYAISRKILVVVLLPEINE